MTPRTAHVYDHGRHGIHNLGRADVIADPARYTAAARDLGPLFYDEVGKVWVCTGYAESHQILTDHRRFSSARSHRPDALRRRGLTKIAEAGAMLLEQMLFMDPPDQTAIRAAVREQFSPSRVRERDAMMRDIASGVLDTLPTDGEIDLVDDFAAKLHTELVGTLLGVRDRPERLTRWADAYGRLIGSLSSLPNVRDREVIPVLDEAMTTLRAEALARRAEPRDDLVSSLVAGVDGAPRPSAPDVTFGLDTVAANCVVFAAGGYQTLTHLVSTGLVLLDRRPDQQELLRSRPELIDSAIDEFMRLDGSSQYLARQATEDVEVGGVVIGAGRPVVVLLAAANLDPRRFTDPTTLDITRQEGRHLGFGLGRHYCIGAPYAERTARWAILGFLQRHRRYRVGSRPDALAWGPHINTRCLEHAWTAVGSAVDTAVGIPSAEPTDRAGSDAIASAVAAVSAGAGGCPVAHALDTAALDTAPAATDPVGTATIDTDPIDTATVDTVSIDTPPTDEADAAVAELLSEAERHRYLHEWNDTAAPLGPHGCWHQVFEERARLAPTAIAVEDPGAAHTFADVDHRANAVARTLRERGVEPGTVVAVVTERSVELVVAMLAIAKAGGAFLLAERTCPPQRLRDMLADARALLLLTDAVSDPALAAAGLPVERLVVADGERLPHPPVTGVSSGDTAYVVFTSGSTGRPKAIAVSHEAVVSMHVAHRRVFGAGPDDRVLQFLSPNFDGCVFDTTMALLCGAVLVVAPLAQLAVGPPLARTLRDRDVTVVTMTPSVWSALPAGALPRLRIAAAAGERLPAAVVRRWLAPGRRFLNLYGPAETAVWATWHECSADEDEPAIGRPTPNKRVYVLDDRQRVVRPGVVGELCVAGVGVGRYLGRPELMDERFRPDPFDDTPGRLLYRTGDLCRRRADGTLEYVGRRDRQVKIRGQRIELDEVERTLDATPGVAASSVVVRDGRLVATVVPGTDWDEAAVRAHLAARLHTAMVPSVFVVTGELPRTATGKVRWDGDTPTPTTPLAGPMTTVIPAAPRSVTAAPAAVATPAPAAPVTPAEPPSRPVETAGFDRESGVTWRIAQFFANCLQIPQLTVKAESDFFSLGGDSLANAELLTAVEDEYGVMLDVDALLREPTPAGIASYVLTKELELAST